MSKLKSEGVPAPRPTVREIEVRSLGQAAARLSLEALRISRMAAELARTDRPQAA